MSEETKAQEPMEEAERIAVANAALCIWASGDLKALYDPASWDMFNDLWGMAWWEYEVDPSKKIFAFVEKHHDLIVRLSDNAVMIVADSI